jgi:hypothetical protein
MPVPILPLALQTSYAELLEQLQIAQVSQWPAGSSFRQRMISGQAYWYVQEPTGRQGRPAERYVGKVSPELDDRIAQAQRIKQADDGRRMIVRSILAAGLPQPDRLAGDVLAALAQADVFRLRAVLVGTLAYQIYPALIGVKLPATALQTGDLDIAQGYGVSIALNDQIEIDFLGCLRRVSPSFQAVSNIFDPTTAASYVSDTQFRVDVLTTNRGAPARGLAKLPSLKSQATPLRFLDYLLRDPVSAAALHRAGVLLTVPKPERYAVYKLIVAAERGADNPKSAKDLLQAESLILALAQQRRADDLAEAYKEAASRGAGWTQRLETSRKKLKAEARAILPDFAT